MTPAEETIHTVLRAQGWLLTRNGWPDFWYVDPTGRMRTVEVKQRGTHLSVIQCRAMEALQRVGIDCYVATVNPRDGHWCVVPYAAHPERARQPRPRRFAMRRLTTPSVKLSVNLPDALVSAVRARAAAEHRSFSHMVTDLLEDATRWNW